nr:hypothetical protein [Tanacetum cinerariifolium]
MVLTFADTHNKIAYLTKSYASEGFNQIIDFLNASLIQYTLTVNPNIYVSCIKQFWSSVSVKKANDVVRLQALIDRKKVIITEDTVCQALRLDDAESIDCLLNEEIFTELARMGYKKPLTKLTFYKAFFLAQWKFFIHTILQCMSAKRIAWNEFSSFMASAVICLATGKGFSKVNTPLFEEMLVQQQAADDVDDVVADSVPTYDVADDVPTADAEPTPPSPPPATTPPPPQDLPFTSQVAPTPPLSPITQPSSPPQQPQPLQTITISMDLLNNLLETCTTLTRRVENLEQDKVAQALDITKLQQRGQEIREEEKSKRFRFQNIEEEEVEVEKNVKVEKNADVQGRLEESQAKVYHIDLEHLDKVLSMHDNELEPAELQKVIEVVTNAKLITEVVIATTTAITDVAPITAATTAATPITAATITAAPSAARRRKGVVIRDPEETTNPSTIIHFEPKSKDKEKGIMDDVIEQVKEKGKQYNVMLRYQALKIKPQTEAQARKNMMVHLKNMAGFKMDYFKGMSYDAIRIIFEKYFNSNVSFLEKSKEQLEEEESRALKRESESLEEKAANSSLEELKRRSWFSKSQKLEIVSVLWSAYYNIYNYTDDLAGKEKISIDKQPFKVLALNVEFDTKIDFIVFGPDTCLTLANFSSGERGVLQNEDSLVESYSVAEESMIATEGSVIFTYDTARRILPVS